MNEPQALPLENQPIGEPADAAPGALLRRSRRPRGGRWPAPLRWLAIVLSISGGLAICGLIGAAVLVARLEKGPIAVDGLGVRIAAGLQKRFGDSHVFRLGQTQIERGEHGPQLTISDFSISGQSGDTVLAAPKARVTLDPLSLVIGEVKPRRLEVVGLELRFSVMANGALSISAGKTPLVLSPLQEQPAVVPGKAPEAGAAPPEPPSAEALAPGETIAAADSARAAMRPAAEALRRMLALAAGDDSALGGLGDIGIAEGKLVFEDITAGRETVFEGLDMRFERTESEAKIALSVQGPSGRLSVAVTAAHGGGGARAAQSVDVEIKNLTFNEIALISGHRDLPFELDTPFDLSLRAGAGSDGEFRMASGNIRARAGFLIPRSAEQEPFHIERAEAAFRWDDSRRQFAIDYLRFEDGETRVALQGSVSPPQSDDGIWTLSLAAAGEGQIGGATPKDDPLKFGQFELTAKLDPARAAVSIDSAVLKGPRADMRMSGRFELEAGQPRLKLEMSAADTPMHSLFRVWPSGGSPTVRAWLMRNLRSGTLTKGELKLDYGPEAFRAIALDKPVPDDNMRLEFAVKDATLTFMPGVQPARGVAATGLVTGTRSRISFTQGHMDSGGRQIAITSGQLQAENRSPEASPVSVNINLAGPVDTLAAVLAEPGLKNHASINLDPSTVKGRIEGRLSVDFKVGKKANPADARIRAQASASNVTLEKAMGREKIEAAALQVSIDGRDFSAKGTGRMFGSPATFSFEKTGKGEVLGNMSVTLDDAARQRMGWSTGAVLTGPVAMKIAGPMGKSEIPQGNIEFDLTRAAIGEIAPGLIKPAGRPARATFALTPRAEGSSLQNFNYQAGSTSARGTVELDRKGAFVSANLTSLKISPSDELSGDIAASSGNLQVKLQGSTIDLRPFIQALTSPAARSGESGDNRGRFDLDLQAKLATGHNRQALADFALKMSRQGGAFQRFELTGRTGRAPVRGRIVPGTGRIEVSAGDGGAAMAFLDLYRRMEGGNLTLSAQASGARIEGTLGVANFQLRDEPGLRRLVTEGASRTDAQGKTQFDPGLVSFDRLRATFSKDQGRIVIYDAILSGQTIGTTLEGFVDFPRDTVNLKGTFVPAYGLNNMFAKIPLFGPILGGGRDEGLLGVNFAVTGKASAPVLNFNPLSAIAPGFLRKIFGAGQFDSAQPPRPQMPLAINPGRQ